MNRQKLIIKSILFLLLVVLIYVKIKNPNPNWAFEIATDVGIVSILLGFGEIILSLVYISLTPLFINFKNLNQKIMNDGVKQLLVAILLLGAGLMSPSNGLDDKVDRHPLQILMVTVLIMIGATVIFLITKRFYPIKETNNNQSK